MKKLALTFCTVLLLATQAPAALAKEVDTKSNVKHFQTVSEYRYKLNTSFYMVKWPVKSTVTKQSTPKETTEKVTTKKVTTKKDTTNKATINKETKQENASTVKTNEVKKQQVEQQATAPKAVQTESAKQTEPAQPTQTVKETATTTDSEIDVIEKQVVELTNKERAKYGLPALAIDKPLMAAAREKSEDMKINNYFSHTSPTYGSPFDRMKALGITYKTAGENIAKGQTSAAQVVEAWMNSEGHRANILNKDFTHIGVGYVKQGHIWTQQFIKK